MTHTGTYYYGMLVMFAIGVVFGVGIMWRRKGNQERDPTIRFAIDPGGSSAQELAEFLHALSELQRSCGGSGLNFRLSGETIGTAVVVEATPVEDAP
jgi:hypothetical protein